VLPEGNQSTRPVSAVECVTRRYGNLDWRVHPARLTPELEAVLRSPDAVLANPGNLLKNGTSTTVGCLQDIVIKRYNFQGARALFKDLFRRARAFRAFAKGISLEKSGIPTAATLAAAEQTRWGLPYRSYLVMKAIPQAVPLHKWTGDRRAATRQAADLIARLHNAGFSHRDLKQDNLLFDAQGRLHLIDLEGLEYLVSVPRAKIVANLSRLMRGAGMSPSFSPADRLHFLRHYCKRRATRPRKLLG
jgi:hypothetical protein